MTGDHPLLGDHPGAKPVYDLDSVTLLGVAGVLRKGFDMAGKELAGAPDLYIGAVVNPGADPIEPEIIKMEKKIAAGAEFFQTQAVFEAGSFEKFIKNISHLRSRVKLLGGIVPLRSAKMARYMNANVPGVFVPEKVIELMDRTGDPAAEAACIAADIFNSIKGMCDGVHFMPIRANHLVAKILDKVRGK
jgi:5,10-methylenetetrahydrofolate reductase